MNVINWQPYFQQITVNQVMLESSVYLALSVYCCCCLLAAFASCALPIETTGRGLQESSQRGREWGQEMVGRAAPPGSERIPQSSSGSQGWQKCLCQASKTDNIRPHAVRIFSSCTTVASQSQAARYLMSCRVWTPPLSQSCHWVKCSWTRGEGEF